MPPIFTIWSALRGLGVIENNSPFEKTRFRKDDDADYGDIFSWRFVAVILGILAIGDLILYFGSRH